MKKIKIYGILYILFCISGCMKYRGEFTVVQTNNNTSKTNNGNFYPKDCYLKFNNNYYFIKSMRIYNNDRLYEEMYPASESLLHQKVEFDLTSTRKPYFFLAFNRHQNYVKYFSKKYKIIKEVKDTILAINKEEVFVFIRNIK